ncbi:MAG TPA: hypothetical protein VK327_00370, partial [Candidatus Paceibacterota bacterium]|nr:hypothetical protein [Candidatus Paceibacterota bacterium]
MNIRHFKSMLVAVTLVGFSFAVFATPLLMPVGGTKPDRITKVAGSVTLRESDGPHGQVKQGFRVYNDSAAEWQKFYGVQFQIKLPDAREVELTASILRFQRTPLPETPVNAKVRISGKGWHTVTLPWSAFDFEQANYSFLKFV